MDENCGLGFSDAGECDEGLACMQQCDHSWCDAHGRCLKKGKFVAIYHTTNAKITIIYTIGFFRITAYYHV